MCIECSGVHRQLGSHVSRVRSLGLDEWPPGHTAVMLATGNAVANVFWEGRLGPTVKPSPNSPMADKEHFIKAKYLNKEFALDAPSLPLAARSGQASSLAASLALNARQHSRESLTEALRFSAFMGNLASVQLLVWVS